MIQSGKRFLSLLSLGLSLGLILSVSETVAQDTPTRTLIVNGQTLDAGVILVEGRSYVDIEGLAEGMGGSVTFEANQISLTIPGPPPSEAAQTPPPSPAPQTPPPSEAPQTPPPSTAPQTPEVMSKDFQKIAVFTLAEMREWKGAISTVVTSGIPVVGTWSQDYHDRGEADLMQAALAASTEPDRQALQLLQQQLTRLSEWADTVLGEREALNADRTINPNSLQNDQSLAKISKCGQFLSSMIVSGTFSNDSSCY
jgi:hypothetical protein